MWKTVILLLATLITVPIVAYYYDTPPNASQLSVIYSLATSYLVLAMLCFFVSIITGNYSQVDKLWSIAPIGYAWQIAYLSAWEPRMIFHRRFDYALGWKTHFQLCAKRRLFLAFLEGDEDYRWAILRAKQNFKRLGSGFCLIYFLFPCINGTCYAYRVSND